MRIRRTDCHVAMTYRAAYAAARSTRARYAVIAEHRQAWYDECGCWPTQAEQARQLGCSRRTIRHALQERNNYHVTESQ